MIVWTKTDTKGVFHFNYMNKDLVENYTEIRNPDRSMDVRLSIVLTNDCFS